MMSRELATAISHLSAAPRDHLDGFILALRRQATAEHQVLDSVVEVLPDGFRGSGRRVIELARRNGGSIDLGLLASAIEAAGLSRTQALEQQTVELVWSGPSQAQSTFRRTDRAWVDLIDEASEEIWMASFSVGSVARIQESLAAALERGVRLNFLLERTQDCGGALRYNGFEAFDETVRQAAILYHWPIDKRDVDSNGNHGLMHAKAIVVDRRAMFVTSANLSGAALERNIEVGIIVRDGPHPQWLADRFVRLIETKVIRRLGDSA